jgi:gliding motility-associated lipoprotein GldH
MKLNLYILLFLVFLFSCKHIHVYDNYTEIDSDGWHYNERIYFKVDITDTSEYYNVYLNIRNTGEYSYSNIWMNCSKKSPNNEVKNQKLEFTLATPDGRWIGNGIGDIIDNQFILEEKVKFHEKGIYTYFFNHEMRQDEIGGIMNIGLTIKKYQEHQNI